jgi:inosine-uridine nucleoside N-ribohydrolase
MGRLMESVTMKHTTILLVVLLVSLSQGLRADPVANTLIPAIIDSDANNELDDQHAIAYFLFNADVFDIRGVTVNDTRNGGGIEGQYDEALRVMKLCKAAGVVPLLKGAAGSYADIRGKLDDPAHDGHEAVDFIIRQARAIQGRKLVLLPIGKLTNITLALTKAPDIVPKVRVVWLGSNYPGKGEYNLDNDISSVNPVIESGVAFEIVTVRYGKQSTGATAVRASMDEVRTTMPGLGPKVQTPVIGRHGGEFTTFGDYSVDLFHRMGHSQRSLFDVVAVAIVKNPEWGRVSSIPAPRLLDDGSWKPQPDSTQRIKIWEHFERAAILEDFYDTMRRPCLSNSRPEP